MSLRVRDRVEFSAYERSYLPEVVRGLVVTLRHFFVNRFGSRRRRYLQTVRYPFEQRTYPLAFRGQHRLVARLDGSPRCVACYMCSTACPAYCIHIIAGEAADVRVEKFPVAFEIDMLRCVYCGLCVEACPEDAIRMDTGVHAASAYRREDAVVGRVNLLAFSGTAQSPPPYGAQNAREGKPRGA